MSDDEIPISGVNSVFLVFTLSAIDPIYYSKILQKIGRCMKKGGKIYFKDYGRMDMVQLRYKSDRCIKSNFYRRSDGTFTKFFVVDDLRKIVEENGFVVKDLLEDKRLIINRKRKVEMYRVWIQGAFSKE